VGDLFRQKTETLAVALKSGDGHNAARQALRGFLEKIVIPPGNGLLSVVGTVGEMLKAAGAEGVDYGGCGGWI
jgi:hypothetical protein